MSDQIPSLGGTLIGPYLRRYAGGVARGRAVIEVGSWLGAGTVHLAQGIVDGGNHAPFHIYDRFKTTRGEIPKAARFGVHLRKGQNTQPLVEQHIRPYGVAAQFHRGSILLANWDNGPIGLYVDDAAKTRELFLHVVHTFGPAWVPGETVLILMDFGYWRSLSDPADIARFRFQQDFVDQHAASFEPLEADEPLDGSTAIFRYRAPLPFDTIPKPATDLKTRLRKLTRAILGGGSRRAAARR